jgi:hypothetical protein
VTEVYVTYPDAELVALALLEPLPGSVVTFLPPNFQPPITQVNRIGGAPDNSDVTDFPILRIACYGTNRMQAWSMAAQAEALILGNRCRAIYVPEYGGDILIDSADIVVGGQLLPDIDPDDRRVVKDIIVGLRRPYGLTLTP